MRNVMTVVLLTLAGAALVESQGGGSPGVECGAPGPPPVRITAQQVSEVPPSYAFLVTNLAHVAITGIVIGRRGHVMPIVGIAQNVPLQMDSPLGWEGRHVHVEETRYLVYLWENRDPLKRIMPQQSAAGFRITLPAAKKDPVQVTFARIPFKASLADGSCQGGLVGLDPIPQTK